jgi:hypothetical protein
MRKTWSDIETDFYHAVKKTALAHAINGDVYKFGIRPKNSKKEDVIIKVSALNASQVQEGTVAIMVYLQPLKKHSDGWIVPDKRRISEIETLVDALPEELLPLMPEYDGIKLFDGVGNYAEPDTEEFFVSVKIKFNYLTQYK